jgi:hypothetical protein
VHRTARAVLRQHEFCSPPRDRTVFIDFEDSSVRDIIARPEGSEFSNHYAPFVAAVPDGDIIRLLEWAGHLRDSTVAGISEATASQSPPPGKWNVRETLGHLADMERMLAYRALRIARADRSPIHGIDQNEYADNSYANRRSLRDLRVELSALRTTTVCLFAPLPANVWLRRDAIDGDVVSLEALAYIIVGHDLHHLRQLADRFDVELRQIAAPSTIDQYE